MPFCITTNSAKRIVFCWSTCSFLINILLRVRCHWPTQSATKLVENRRYSLPPPHRNGWCAKASISVKLQNQFWHEFYIDMQSWSREENIVLRWILSFTMIIFKIALLWKRAFPAKKWWKFTLFLPITQLQKWIIQYIITNIKCMAYFYEKLLDLNHASMLQPGHIQVFTYTSI